MMEASIKRGKSGGRKGDFQMKVRQHAKSLYGLALFACAMLLGGVPAQAQQEVRGKFTLPTQVSWGKAILPAGTYTYMVLSTGFPNILHVEGNGKSANIIATAWLSPTVASKDILTIIKTKDGRSVVRKFSSQQLGLVFEYAIPKSVNGTMAKKKGPSDNAKTASQSSGSS